MDWLLLIAFNRPGRSHGCFALVPPTGKRGAVAPLLSSPDRAEAQRGPHHV